MPKSKLAQATLVGIEQDEESFELSHDRLARFKCANIELHKTDFLEFFDNGTLSGPSEQLNKVDAIIANPPYVRTQVMGAKLSQELAKRFNLSGPVDLYQAFLVAMAKQLKPSGVLGVITSNRFLTTKGGLAIRRFLRRSFEIDEVFDLGDTKLFEAAVLPALLFGHRKSEHEAQTTTPKFVRIYQIANDNEQDAIVKNRVVDCVTSPESGLFRVDQVHYRVTTGSLVIPSRDDAPWRCLSHGKRNG